MKQYMKTVQVNDAFGSMLLMQDRASNVTLLDGELRRDCLSELYDTNELGFGDVSPKHPSDFEKYIDTFITRQLVPCDLMPISRLEMLAISVTLNMQEASGTALTDEDTIRILMDFLKLKSPDLI